MMRAKSAQVRQPLSFGKTVLTMGVTSVGMIILILLPHRRALADNFADVRYDAGRDQLVLTMAYRGTNLDHHFSLNWGVCQNAGANGVHPIGAEVLDDQWRDFAQRDFIKTSPITLAQMNCRPAVLTLKTAPRFFTTLQIPPRSKLN